MSGKKRHSISNEASYEFYSKRTCELQAYIHFTKGKWQDSSNNISKHFLQLIVIATNIVCPGYRSITYILLSARHGGKLHCPGP